MTGHSPHRRPGEDYETPEWVTKLLLEKETLGGIVWEPACGNGAISRLIPNCLSSDIRNYAGAEVIDFLQSNRHVDTIITNPPFSLMEAFMCQGLKLAKRKLILLGRLLFLEGKHRYYLFQHSPPNRVWVLSERPSFLEDGRPVSKGGMICFAWFVWDKDFTGPTQLGWLKK